MATKRPKRGRIQKNDPIPPIIVLTVRAGNRTVFNTRKGIYTTGGPILSPGVAERTVRPSVNSTAIPLYKGATVGN